MCAEFIKYCEKLRFVTCDFEKALINAVNRHFKNITIVGCLFHFKQCTFRYLDTLNLPQEEVDIFKKQLDNLLSVPKEEVETVLQFFETNNQFKSNTTEYQQFKLDQELQECSSNISNEMHNCHFCNAEKSEPVICCDQCKNWYHYDCVSIISAPKEQWYCPICYQKRKAHSSKNSQKKLN